MTIKERSREPLSEETVLLNTSDATVVVRLEVGSQILLRKLLACVFYKICGEGMRSSKTIREDW